jgi:hypothetical protein
MTNEWKWEILRSLPVLNDKEWDRVVAILDAMVKVTEDRRWSSQYLF